MRRRARTRQTWIAFAAGASIAGLAAGCDLPSKTTERACSEAQAISVGDLHGYSLPLKSIALTFDDGPGPRTGELSAYLKSHGIRAGFFVNGKNVQNPGVLAQLIADGHVIGNHTQTHTSLTGRSTGSLHLDDPTTVSELSQTDAIIAPYVTADRFLFRAPFGDFDNSSATAINGSPMHKYVGPVNWDIGDHMGPHQAVDWDCWQPGSDGLVLTVAECGDRYLQEIDAVGRGVVLMHDPYFIGGNPALGGTVDMVKLMVPSLEAKGFTFVRVDEVPTIAAALPPLPVEDAGAGSGAGSDGAADSGADAGAADKGNGGASPGTSGGSTVSSSAPGVSASNDTTAITEPTPAAGAGASGGKPDPCPGSPQRINAK